MSSFEKASELFSTTFDTSEYFESLNVPYGLVKGLKIKHKIWGLNELDVFCTIGDRAICIECKTGEFRKDIEKYRQLKKRLMLDNNEFVMCIIGLDDIQTDGLTNTYGLTFTNQTNILAHIKKIIEPAIKKQHVLDIETVDLSEQVSKVDKPAVKEPPKPDRPQANKNKTGFLKGIFQR